MRPILQELYNKFSGTNVFVVGGGFSLHDFDFSKLNGRNVIAVNAAYKHVDETAIIYWGDASWGVEHESKIKDHPSPYKFSSRLNINLSTDKLGTAGCHWLQCSGSFGYDSNINNVRGNNSGGQAINFAINLGAKNIILLGFDMKYTGSRSHFHKDHTFPTPNSNYNEMFIPSIESLAKETSHLSVDIINCNKNSALRCFKFGDVEKFLC